MAIKSVLSNQMSVIDGGFAAIPEWKQLGYSSEAEYLLAKNYKPTTTTVPKYQVGSATSTPTPTYVVSPSNGLVGTVQPVNTVKNDLSQYLNGSVVGNAASVGSGSKGGVTDEGAIIGNPSVENMPTIKDSSNAKVDTAPSVPPQLHNVAEDLDKEGIVSIKPDVVTPAPSVPVQTPVATPTVKPTTSTPQNTVQTPVTQPTTQSEPYAEEFKAKYQGNSFEDWYKANFGTDYDPSVGLTRPNGMSETDWAIGQRLYGYYQTQKNLESQHELDKSTLLGNYTSNSQNLENTYNNAVATEDEAYQAQLDSLERNYGTANESLDKEKRKSQQEQAILLARLNKYLPQTMRRAGLEGTGVSETTQLSAYNNYASNMGEIEGSYQDTKASLLNKYSDTKAGYDTTHTANKNSLNSAYMTDKTNLDTAYNTNLSAMNNAFNEAMTSLSVGAGNDSQSVYDKYRDEYMSERDKVYNSVLAAIEASPYATDEDMSAFLEQFKGNLTKEQYNTLSQIAKGYVSTNATAKREQDQTTAYNEALTAIGNSSYADSETMTAFVEKYRGKVSDTQFESLMRTAQGVVEQNQKKNTSTSQNNTYTDALSMFDGGYFNTAEEARVYVNGLKGKVTEEQYNTLSQMVSYMENSPEEQERVEAQKEQNELNKYYSVTTTDVKFNNNGGWWIFGATDYSLGDNFSVVDSSGFIYRIESGGEVADTNIINAARGVKEGEVFGYGGQIYFKTNGKIYLVQKRANSYADHYRALQKRVFGE